jgi:hypothetical protein
VNGIRALRLKSPERIGELPDAHNCALKNFAMLWLEFHTALKLVQNGLCR